MNIDEDIKRFAESSRRFREEIKDNPEKAKEFLLEAGIVVKSKSSPSGVKLAKRYRSGN